MKIEIELSELEFRVMRSFCVDPQLLVENFVRERIRGARSEIVRAEVDRLSETGQQIPSTLDEIVISAFNNGTAKELPPE